MKPEKTKYQELLKKLIRGGRKNLLEWFEKIADEFCQEVVVEKRVWVESIEKIFYTDFTEQFIYSLLTMLFKFLIDRGVGHIVEPHPSLIEPPANTNWVKKQKAWEKFIAEREWEYLLKK